MTDQRHDALEAGDGGDGGRDGADRTSGPGAARLRLVLLVVLVLALLASAATVAWLVLGRRGEAEDLQAERDTVMAQARQFILRSETFGPDDLDADGKLTDYAKAVEELVTPKFSTVFKQSVQYRELLAQQQRAGQSVEVLGEGVQALDDDSATVLVAGQYRTTQQTKSGQTRRLAESPFRVVIGLVKIDGTWLVDESQTATEASS